MVKIICMELKVDWTNLILANITTFTNNPSAPRPKVVIQTKQLKRYAKNTPKNIKETISTISAKKYIFQKCFTINQEIVEFTSKCSDNVHQIFQDWCTHDWGQKF